MEVSGMLLYARTSEIIQPDSDYVMSVNKISVKTLDLNQEFGIIRNQLDSIIINYFGENYMSIVKLNLGECIAISKKIAEEKIIGGLFMVDKFSKETRSYIMSRIRGRDTKPEILVRSYLFSRGLRFRKNDRRYPGSPDVVLPKYNTMVFVHGCFWHLHEGCKHAKMPKSNIDYWEKKLYGNRERDERNRKELEDMGWNVIIVWECQLKKDKIEKTLDELYTQITSQI